MIVIGGKNNISVLAIDFLKQNYQEELAVICNKTDPGANGWQRSLAKYAHDNGIKIITLDDAYRDADIFVSLEFDRIVKPEKFKKSKLYNIHFSDLPKYKGMYTSVWPILNGEKRAGVTLHEIDSGIDTGPVVAQKLFDLEPSFRARDLYRNYLNNSFKLFLENIDGIIKNKCASVKQHWYDSSYYSKGTINFSSVEINLNATAHDILKQVYAFTFREYQIPMVLGKKVVEADILDRRSKYKPGMLLVERTDSFDISTIDYDLRLYVDRVEWIHKFSYCNKEMCGTILKNLAGVNDRNEKGWSPLIVAAYNGNHAAVSYLLDNGALIEDENYNGTSVLMYAKDFALKTGNKTIFDELLSRGANIEKKDFYGKSLIEYLSLEEAKSLGL